MRRPLDGLALLAYSRRLGFPLETQALLAHIRSSPPSRTPGARRGNMPVWYPSTKMQCIIKAESAKVEFPFLLQAEHDDDILEVWDQPPPIPLAYQDRGNRLQHPMHTADYFLFRAAAAGWVECKPTQELVKQAETRPNRYRLDEQGVWRCPPGEAFAARYGLKYEVWASDQVNWAAQDNALYLEDYYQDLERLSVPAATLNLLHHLVDESIQGSFSLTCGRRHLRFQLILFTSPLPSTPSMWTSPPIGSQNPGAPLSFAIAKPHKRQERSSLRIVRPLCLSPSPNLLPILRQKAGPGLLRPATPIWRPPSSAIGSFILSSTRMRNNNRPLRLASAFLYVPGNTGSSCIERAKRPMAMGSLGCCRTTRTAVATGKLLLR